MKAQGKVILALTVAAVLASPAWAQRTPGAGGFMGGQLGLLGAKSVQEELKLTEDQIGKVKELAEKQRESFKELGKLSREERRTKFEDSSKASNKAVAEILKPEQVKRLKQISWQQRGGAAMEDPEVAEALKLTDEQKGKIKTLREDTGKEMRELIKGGNREEARKKMGELRKANNEKLQAVLTAEQKAKLKELTGEPFKGELGQPGSGGRGRPGRTRSKRT